MNLGGPPRGGVKNDPFLDPFLDPKNPPGGSFSGPKSVKCYSLLGQKGKKSVFDKGGVLEGGVKMTPFWTLF